MTDAYDFADCDQEEGSRPAGDMAWGDERDDSDPDSLGEFDPKSDAEEQSADGVSPGDRLYEGPRRERRRGTIDLSWFDPKHAAIMDLIFRSRSSYGCVDSDGLDPGLVADLVTAGWLEWWPGLALLTFTPQTAVALKVRLLASGWQSTAKRLPRAAASRRAKEVTATAAGVNLDGRPEGWTPRNDGGMAHPVGIIGLNRAWDGPLASRPCPTCGNAPYRAGGGLYCIECDGLPPEAKNTKRKGVA